MNKQMKTLNNNKINLNFPKPTSLPTTKPYPTKVSNLPPTNKARKQATMRNTKTQFLLSNYHKLHIWPMSLSKQNQTIPKFNPSVLS